jgi:hypothetical protein
VLVFRAKEDIPMLRLLIAGSALLLAGTANAGCVLELKKVHYTLRDNPSIRVTFDKPSPGRPARLLRCNAFIGENGHRTEWVFSGPTDGSTGLESNEESFQIEAMNRQMGRDEPLLCL